MRRKPKSFHNCASAPAVWQDLKTWYASNLGRKLLETERLHLARILPNLFGYHLLQVGRAVGDNLFADSKIRHCAVMDLIPGGTRVADCESLLCGSPEAMPVAADSLDLLLLPHVLEFAEDPHQVLREAERALVAEGHLVLLGFNPWSNWMPWRLVLGWRRRVPWCGKFLSTTRLRDWLALLGFEVVHADYYFYRPPLPYEGLMGRLRGLESVGPRFWRPLGGGYLLVARKKVATLTPIKPRWRPRRRLVAPGLAEPTQGRHRHLFKGGNR